MRRLKIVNYEMRAVHADLSKVESKEVVVMPRQEHTITVYQEGEEGKSKIVSTRYI